MDIQIIKDKYHYKYAVCPHCNSELKIKKDIIEYHYDKGYNIANINCPCCNENFILCQ